MLFIHRSHGESQQSTSTGSTTVHQQQQQPRAAQPVSTSLAPRQRPKGVAKFAAPADATNPKPFKNEPHELLGQQQNLARANQHEPYDGHDKAHHQQQQQQKHQHQQRQQLQHQQQQQQRQQQQQQQQQFMHQQQFRNQQMLVSPISALLPQLRVGNLCFCETYFLVVLFTSSLLLPVKLILLTIVK